jgi:hypothetical protein
MPKIGAAIFSIPLMLLCIMLLAMGQFGRSFATAVCIVAAWATAYMAIRGIKPKTDRPSPISFSDALPSFGRPEK